MFIHYNGAKSDLRTERIMTIQSFAYTQFRTVKSTPTVEESRGDLEVNSEEFRNRFQKVSNHEQETKQHDPASTYQGIYSIMQLLSNMATFLKIPNSNQICKSQWPSG